MSQPGNPGGTSGPEAIDRDVRTLREVSRVKCTKPFIMDHGTYGTFLLYVGEGWFPHKRDGLHPRGGDKAVRFFATSLADDTRRFLWLALMSALVAMSQSAHSSLRSSAAGVKS